MKVTDKRMFTPDGRLREEFSQDFAETASDEKPAASSSPPPPEPPAAAPARPQPPAGPPPDAWERTPPSPPLEIPDTPGAMGAPSFFDLVAMLAEPISIYLGDLPLPDGGSAENLDAARAHIDLLVLLRQKTAGNLTVQESSVLDDLLYRLRLRYIQKRG